MVKLTFAKDVKQALAGAQSVLVLAPKAAFAEKSFPKVFGSKIRGLAVELAGDAKPGDFGAAASTLTGTKEPKKLIIGVLPDKVSRYNSPARPEAIYKQTCAAGLIKDARATIIVMLDDAAHLTAAVNAIGRAFPIYTAKSSEEKRDPKITIVAVDRKGKTIPMTPIARETMIVAREVAALVDTPPTDMNPEALSNAARAMFEELEDVEVHEIVGEELLAQKLGGIHAVGRCAMKPPRLLRATYTPKPGKKTSDEHVVLVGKGITFDTGGLHIKGRGMMETMKADMGGAAAVTGAFRVLAKLGASRKISVVLCIAENAIGPYAYKPDDILSMHSGKTVEINNTDAEGRLLLADGVSYAARELGADYIFDAATLTGAQLIATGMMHAAVMSNDAELEDLVVGSGYASGDLIHPLPFAPEFYRQEFKSPIADMRNSVKDRSNAQTSCAGQFIYNHIEDTNVKWAHVDLAGPAFRGDRGTGYGVALLSEAVSRLSS